MKPDSIFFKHKDVEIHVLLYKGGPDDLFCFHGYGQKAEVFDQLAVRLLDTYSIYAFDLFYHGESYWPDCEKPLTKEFLAEMMSSFIRQHQISKVSLCGYSMGGKIVLSLLESIYHRVEKLLLIAPDGIKTNLWYSMATYPYWMRRLFQYTVKKPLLYFFFSSLLNKIGLVDKGVIRFAKTQMNTRGRRRKVYCTWLTYRKLMPNIQKVARISNMKKIEVRLFMGTYDRIITKESIQPLLSQLDLYKLHYLSKGHNTLIDDVANFHEEIL